MTSFSLPVGRDVWSLELPPTAIVCDRTARVASLESPRDRVRAALESSRGMDAPLRRGLTPDDRVCVVLDESLPHVAELLAGLFEHLGDGGIGPAAITVLTPPGSNGAWVEDLPDEFADVVLEAHDPTDRKTVAYLATTKAGRRVYLNRTLIEADAVVVVCGRRYDPVVGYSGAETALFPALSDEETRAEFAGTFTPEPPVADRPNALRTEAAEVAFLFGLPFQVQVIAGAGDDIEKVIAGLPTCALDGVVAQDARWRFPVEEFADLVVAAVAGDGNRTTFADLAHALACAARVVSPGGRIALLTRSAPVLGDGGEALRNAEEPAHAIKRLAKEKPADLPAAVLWAAAAQRASLFVASEWPDELTEELFATPIASAAEVQRLVDAAKRTIVIPDADRALLIPGDSAVPAKKERK